jgi:broad specificity phosphatase PhoE
MKSKSTFLLLVFLIAVSASVAAAQHRNLTVILVRHAEKDVSPTADKQNPELTADGKTRAEKLVKTAGKYKPKAIFSSNFIRTRDTAKPLAAKRELEIQIYDHRNLQAIAELIMSGKYKKIFVVGHNSTTPALANLLIGSEKYKPLLESEYDKMFVIKIYKKKTRPNKIKDKVVVF